MGFNMKTTLEQWQLLQAVVNYGSFARAATACHRSQSSLSYQIGLMQQRLGVSLLKVVGRKAELTPVGQQLLAQATPLLRGFQALENRALALKGGERVRLDLVVDSIFPKSRLFTVLRHFQQIYPSTQIHLTEVLRSERFATLQQRRADVYIITSPNEMIAAGKWLLNVDFVAVVQRDHPILKLPAPLCQNDLARYPLIEIVSRDQQQLADRQVATAENWTFTTVEAAIEAVINGVGYGWLPEERIKTQLLNGELVVLPLLQGAHRTTSVYLFLNENKSDLDEQTALLAALFEGNELIS